MSNIPRQLTPEEVYAHSNCIVSVGHQYHMDWHLIQDLIQETVIRLCCGTNPPMYDPNRGMGVKGFIKMVACSMASNLLRKRKSKRFNFEENQAVIDAQFIENHEFCHNDVPTLAMKDHHREIFEIALEKLARSFHNNLLAIVLRLVDMEGEKPRHVAKQLRLPEKEVYSSLAFARRHFEKIVKDLEYNELAS